MIDDSDGDFALLASMGTGGWGIVGVILAVILYSIAAYNRDDCSKRHCAAGLQPRVVSHECICVGAPAEGTK